MNALLGSRSRCILLRRRRGLQGVRGPWRRVVKGRIVPAVPTVPTVPAVPVRRRGTHRRQRRRLSQRKRWGRAKRRTRWRRAGRGFDRRRRAGLQRRRLRQRRRRLRQGRRRCQGLLTGRGRRSLRENPNHGAGPRVRRARHHHLTPVDDGAELVTRQDALRHSHLHDHLGLHGRKRQSKKQRTKLVKTNSKKHQHTTFAAKNTTEAEQRWGRQSRGCDWPQVSINTCLHRPRRTRETSARVLPHSEPVHSTSKPHSLFSFRV